MKTQEIVEYRIYCLESAESFTTDSCEEAKSYFEEGWFVAEERSMY